MPGEVKTRLAADIGAEHAAEVAAAALLDTLALIVGAFGDEAPRVLALSGALSDAVAGDEIASALDGWTVIGQRGGSFADRLAAAHVDAALAHDGPTLQIGMDTPHVAPQLLRDAALLLERHDGVLGPAEDGGWWLLGLTDPRWAERLRDVPMSSTDTGDLTLAALTPVASMALTATTYDVDTVIEAERAAADAPHTRVAQAWTRLRGNVGSPS